jgi:hypothetical protein
VLAQGGQFCWYLQPSGWEVYEREEIGGDIHKAETDDEGKIIRDEYTSKSEIILKLRKWISGDRTETEGGCRRL